MGNETRLRVSKGNVAIKLVGGPRHGTVMSYPQPFPKAVAVFDKASHAYHNYARAEHSNVYVHDGEDLKMIEREEDMSGVFHINSGPKSRQVGFNCETELYNFLKDYANTFDMSVSSVIRRLILIGGYCENHHGHRSMPASYESVEEAQGFDPKLFDDYDEKNPFEENDEGSEA